MAVQGPARTDGFLPDQHRFRIHVMCVNTEDQDFVGCAFNGKLSEWRKFQAILAIARKLPMCYEYRDYITIDRVSWSTGVLHAILDEMLPARYAFLHRQSFFFDNSLAEKVDDMVYGGVAFQTLWSETQTLEVRKILRRAMPRLLSPDEELNSRLWALRISLNILSAIERVRDDKTLDAWGLFLETRGEKDRFLSDAVLLSGDIPVTEDI